eukprot:scaffold17422_cov67-Cyclotella_meneghiniana.AAC.4
MSPRISSHGYCYLVGASSPFTELKIGYDVHHAIVQFLCDCTIGEPINFALANSRVDKIVDTTVGRTDWTMWIYHAI